MDINLDRRSEVSLSKQLAEQLREAILSGYLSAGEKIPSSRQLSEELQVSRSTVVESIRQLISEGYLQTVEGSRTIVNADLASRPAASARTLSALTAFGKAAAQATITDWSYPESEFSFFFWQTAFDELPLEDWSRNLWRKTRLADQSLVDFAGDRAGSLSLREAIATHVVSQRGIDCHPEQVIIVLGFQQALDLIIRIHLTGGDVVALEEPCFPEARETMFFHGITSQPLAVDSDGLNPLDLIRSETIKAVFTTPSHQFPRGAVLSLPRRLALLSWAQQTGSIIVEDDYDWEFQYADHPVPALKALDKADSVIYVSTFSKSLYPSFGIGFLVVPERFVHLHANARRIISDPVPLQLQEALADFISEGHFNRHLRRMRVIYAERRDALLSALKKTFGKSVSITGTASGLHVLVRFNLPLTSEMILKRAMSAGVSMVSTERFYSGASINNEFILGYANLSPDAIRTGIGRLGKALNETVDV